MNFLTPVSRERTLVPVYYRPPDRVPVDFRASSEEYGSH